MTGVESRHLTRVFVITPGFQGGYLFCFSFARQENTPVHGRAAKSIKACIHTFLSQGKFDAGIWIRPRARMSI